MKAQDYYDAKYTYLGVTLKRCWLHIALKWLSKKLGLEVCGCRAVRKEQAK